MNLVLTHGIPPDFRGGVHLFYTAIRHGVSPEFIGSRHCIPMAFTPESPPVQGTGPVVIVLKVVPVTGAIFSGFTLNQSMCASLFPRPLLFVLQWAC